MEDNVLRLIARPKRRSPLFWWLFEHYDELRAAQATGGLGIPWSQLVGKFAAMGLTAANGKPLTPNTARKTWQRVHKAIERMTAFPNSGGQVVQP
ncbi:hypothetical protein M2322_004150 [Rhodoblastus acidophilus]|uniref:hypothetical protein n=1 Tax=Rhodoblastus acidophilus TaxID=1074 RepID=UPI002224A357|nr:hypothetical protein [Rhodoblastus acidophilus]MCW2318581.1 hypothetical protein [Rhodoblastus acidophilus]